MELRKLEFKGDFIDGVFVKPNRPDGEIVKVSPSDLKDKILTLKFEHDHVDRAVESARKAFRTWGILPSSERIAMVMKIKDQFEKNLDLLSEVIARETGKPLWEALTEAKTMVAKFTVTAEHSLKLVAETEVPNALPGINGYIRYKPRGVMAVLGPFNFPGHLPNGHIVPALMTGNTVIFKPSEQTPVTGQIMAELIEKAGLPPGVFNLVQGAAETGKRIADHPDVDGVLFTGSYEVGLKIKEKTLNQASKLLALEMGGKNSSIIWSDADFNKALYETLIGSFVSAGQRCSCTSRILIQKDIADKFVDEFYKAAKKLKIDHWSNNPFMGPLINGASVEKYLRFQEIAQREGAEKIMRGKALEIDNHQGHYVTPSIYRVKGYDSKSVYQTHEIFGPNVVIYTVDSLEEAIEINNAPGYGLVTSLFSKDRKKFETVFNQSKMGLVNWNRTTNGASSRLPFGGLGKSGNDRPAGHFSVYYCTVAVASLEDSSPFQNDSQLPGMDFEPI